MSARYRKLTCIVSLVVLVMLTACLGGGEETPPVQATEQVVATEALDAAYTQAAETIIAELTSNAPTATSAAPEAPPTEVPTETLPPTSTTPPTETPLPSETPLPTNTPLPSSTPTLTASPTPVEPTFTLAYEDDFSYPLGWTVESGDRVSFRYNLGGYVITNNVVNDIAYSTRSTEYTKVRVEVDGSRVKGPSDGYYGVICQFSNGSNYYVLAVGSDGWFGIGKKQTGKLQFLQQGKDTAGIINMGGVNRVRGDCLVGSLTLYVNGQKMAQVQDPTFFGGAVGMAAGTRSVPGLEVLFDNFAVYTPQ